jgi:hypothetical protein
MRLSTAQIGRLIIALVFAGALVLLVVRAGGKAQAAAPPPRDQGLLGQTQQDAEAKSAGCISCHTKTDSATMHPTGTVRLGCTDCHGGDAGVSVAAGVAAESAGYQQAKKKAHVLPRNKENISGGANPVRAYADWIKESYDFIRFVNPGDLRVAAQSCGTSGCHTAEVQKVRTSMMTHGAMLWEAGLYNNGAFPYKNAHFGEAYGEDGSPQRLQTWPPPTAEETKTKGVLPFLDPLQRWEVSMPGNALRVFERGGGKRGETANPNPEEDAGRPDVKLGERGFGTELRTDPVFLGLQKTRLLDPLLSFPGTNDQPGDYRGSGCTGCHVVYANDRSTFNSAQYAQYGNEGHSITVDPTIPKNQSGHPLQHVFTRTIPSSQCMSCHVHPGTNMMATYFGYTFWDNEVDDQKMYPKIEHDPTQAELQRAHLRNPEGATARGLWSDVKFLEKTGTPEFNKDLQHTQFADFHSHGWIFRAVYKHDRKGNLLDADGKIVSFTDPDKFAKAVHLKDIHLEKGMQCVDCHFEQDSHGNGKLYGETRNAVEITCIDCHGTISAYANLTTSGPAAPVGGTRLDTLRTSWRQSRFYWRGEKLFQRSVMEQGKEWEVVQVKDTITPGNIHYNEKSRLAKTIQKDGFIWGNSRDMEKLAHGDSRMTCQSCHTSWAPNCFGCHLEMTANQKMPALHNEGQMSRNWTSYNFQVLRDDSYMLGIDGTVTGNKVSPVRSACAIIVSSQNANRDWLYFGQQTVSAEGFSGQSFSPFVPHTVRAKETKQCTDCHVSSDKDNNAWMAQLMLQGTNFLNYMGQYIYVAKGDEGFEAVPFQEKDEPQTVIGSDFHRVAYPERYKKFIAHKSQLKTGYEHAGKEVLDLQMRGEYLYAAMGTGGLRIFDIANIDNKDFSERMTTAPVSPLGQRLYVKTKFAADIASPTTLAVDPTRERFPENEEQPIHPIYAYLYVADKYEGLVVIGNTGKAKTPGVATLLDGEPRNNFISRALAFNPSGALNGAHRIVIAGTYAYLLCDAGLQVVSLDDPLHPKITATIPAASLPDARGLSIQFRYAFVVDREGLKVLDATDLAHPTLVQGATVPVEDARNIYVSRTYAFIAGGKQGIVIVDVEKPEHPKLDQIFNANGALNDTRDIKIGMVSASQFAFVADGKNGMRIVQVFSPGDNPEFYGFSPRPTPKLIATYRGKGEALAISKGIDRDRAVDESGNQLAVFGRRGARPFTLKEMQKMYLREGKLFTVTDTPPGPPQ